MRVARFIGGYARRRWPGLMGVTAASASQVGLGLARPWPLKVLIDNALLGHRARGVVGVVLGVLPGAGSRTGITAWAVAGGALVVLGTWATESATEYFGVVFRRRISGDVAEDLFAHAQRLSLRSHRERGVGDMVRRLTVDAEAISGVTSDAVVPVGTAIANLAGMFVIMVSLDPPLALVALGVAPVVAWSLHRYAAPMMDRAYEQHQAEGQLYQTVEQTLSALPVVQAFDREVDHDQRFAGHRRSVVNAAVTTTATQMRFKVAVGVATAVGTGALMWIGGHQALSGALSLGTIIVFLSYLTSLYDPLASVTYAASSIQEAAGSARRVLEVLDATPELVDGPRSISRASGRLSFDRVGFGYRAERPTLHEVSFEVAPGEVV
ncbi:MAG: hypothetical protein J2P59_12400, partial [Acidimicrobiales bacterium]|nr:hypothetical protein [Acidimicrobiales bacterium]